MNYRLVACDTGQQEVGSLQDINLQSIELGVVVAHVVALSSATFPARSSAILSFSSVTISFFSQLFTTSPHAARQPCSSLLVMNCCQEVLSHGKGSLGRVSDQFAKGCPQDHQESALKRMSSSFASTSRSGLAAALGSKRSLVSNSAVASPPTPRPMSSLQQGRRGFNTSSMRRQKAEQDGVTAQERMPWDECEDNCSGAFCHLA